MLSRSLPPSAVSFYGAQEFQKQATTVTSVYVTDMIRTGRDSPATVCGHAPLG